MLRSAKRLSLVAQTADILREHIASGSAGEQLPSERELCEQLSVSRVTLRAALVRLSDEGLIRGGKGRRRQIVKVRRVQRRTATSRNVIILSPIALQAVDPRVLFWIDELRKVLNKEDFKLDFITQRNCYTDHPVRALEEEASRLCPAAWLLYLSTHLMQQWFSARGLSAVIAGSRYEDVRLPSIDVDHRATCRHAVGLFLARGHRRMALLNPRSIGAGDIESELGFREAGEAAGNGVETLIARHDGTVRDICACLDHLLASKRKPTAFLISRSTHALAAVSHLIRKGVHFPQDAALIARDHDFFLEHVVPSVARYQINLKSFAHKLSRVVIEVASGGNPRMRDYRIIPQFIPGETLG